MTNFFGVLLDQGSHFIQHCRSICYDFASDTPTTGRQSILVVRVVGRGWDPDGVGYDYRDRKVWGCRHSENALSSSIFRQDDLSVKSQTEACSHGQLIFEKAPNRQRTNSGALFSTDIANGVVTVRTWNVWYNTVPNASVLVDAATDSLKNMFAVNHVHELADHLLYCIPSNRYEQNSQGQLTRRAISSFTGRSLGYQTGVVWIMDKAFLSTPLQMHELFHDLRLPHSNDLIYEDEYGLNTVTGEYGDRNGYLGGVGYLNGRQNQHKCFNAAKSWQLGWYSNRHLTLRKESNPTYEGQLDSILSDPTSPGPLMLIKIESPSSDVDYYLNFNIVGDINKDMDEGQNQVIVVSQGRQDNPPLSTIKASYLQAMMNEGEVWSQKFLYGATLNPPGPGVEGGNDRILVEVNDINTNGGFANIKVCFVDPTTGDCFADATSSCVDVAGWYDSDGPVYDCNWYTESQNACENYGHEYENFGHTANTACCACRSNRKSISRSGSVPANTTTKSSSFSSSSGNNTDHMILDTFDDKGSNRIRDAFDSSMPLSLCIDDILKIELMTDDHSKTDNGLFLVTQNEEYLLDEWDFQNDWKYEYLICIYPQDCTTLNFFDRSGDGILETGYLKITYNGIVEFDSRSGGNYIGSGKVFRVGSGC